MKINFDAHMGYATDTKDNIVLKPYGNIGCGCGCSRLILQDQSYKTGAIWKCANCGNIITIVHRYMPDWKGE